MYDVLDVCYYIIKYSNDKGHGVSNLKLQKLLYFIQAWFLINTRNPCFKEKIEAWDFGSVVPIAYYEFKQYACVDIPSVRRYFNGSDWVLETIDCVDDLFVEFDKYLLNQVVDKFANYTATDLLNLIHHQKPWLDAYLSNNNEITNEMLLAYFTT